MKYEKQFENETGFKKNMSSWMYKQRYIEWLENKLDEKNAILKDISNDCDRMLKLLKGGK